MWMALAPMLSTGGRCILTSTPFANDGIYYDLWHNDKNGFYKLLITWDAHPERDEGWAKEFRKMIGDDKFEREFGCKFASVNKK
jgi:hypothetical protein